MTGQLGQVIVNVVDNLMVGRLGAASLASVSLAISIYIIFLIVGLGISFALPPLLAKADGAKQFQRVGLYFYHSLIINIVYALISILLIEIIIPFLGMIGHDPEVVALAIPYLRISAYAMIPMMLFQTFRCYSEGLSYTKLPMYAIIIGNVVNIILNYMFIFGNWGAPALGVKGAALSTLLARILMLAILIVLIYKREDLWNYLKLKVIRIRKIIFKDLFRLGIPTSLQMFFEVSGFAGAALLMGVVGKDAQAAHQIAINMSAVTFLICSGLGMACSVRVGNRLGEKNISGLRRAGLSCIIQVVLIMLVFSLIFILFRTVLPTFYINDVNVISIASILLIMAAIFQIPDGVQVVALGALRGLQDVKIPTFITFVAYWIFGLPISYVAAFYLDFGPVGIWLGLVIGLIISSSLLTLRFYHKSKVI